MTQAINPQFNPFNPEFHVNPYPIYEHLRREDPIHWSFLNAWIVTRYADAEAILKDPRFQVDNLPQRLLEKNRYLKQGNLTDLSKTIEKWLFFLEPPDHTKLRGIASKVFSAASLEAMRPEIQNIINELISKVEHSGQMDLMKDFANPLPAITIMKILGLPVEDYSQVMRWSNELFFVFDQPMSLEGYQKQNQMAIEAREYLLHQIKQQKGNSSNTLLGKFITARDTKHNLTEDEIIGFCIMLFIVGQETTKSLIGNAVLALLNHPQKMEQLKQNPGLIKNAIEELLRYDSPVQVIARLAREDVQIKGKTIRKGDKVIICIGAANRDPDQFTNPDMLDFNRPNRNLPFGEGMHFCLGAFLARMQGQLAIKTLLERLHNLELKTQEIEWRESITLRGLKTLPVTFNHIT